MEKTDKRKDIRMFEKRTFASFEREKCKKLTSDCTLWEDGLIVYQKSYLHLLSEIKNCKYVELSFNSKEEAQILCSNGAGMVVLNNLKEDTWDWQEFV